MLQSERDIAIDGSVTLRLVGELTIETASEMREILLGEMQESSIIRVNCNDVTNIDFFGLQMLCSAHRTSVAKKKLLTWDGQKVELIKEVGLSNGFSRHCGCSLCPQDIACMWI